MTIPDPQPIRAFLDDRHAAYAADIGGYATTALAARPAPHDDDGARREARALLAVLGAAGRFAPILEQDWRACCLAREALAALMSRTSKSELG